MAGTPYDPKKFEESKSYHQKHIELKPNDPEPYYWIGVIDWTLAFRANGELRAAYNRDRVQKQVRDTDPLPASLRADYTSKYGPLVEEGITMLQKSIQVKPDYDDAMAYLNLLYRRKADMVESADERAALLKQADDLVDKVKEIKQKRAEQPQQPSGFQRTSLLSRIGFSKGVPPDALLLCGTANSATSPHCIESCVSAAFGDLQLC